MNKTLSVDTHTLRSCQGPWQNKNTFMAATCFCVRIWLVQAEWSCPSVFYLFRDLWCKEWTQHISQNLGNLSSLLSQHDFKWPGFVTGTYRSKWKKLVQFLPTVLAHTASHLETLNTRQRWIHILARIVIGIKKLFPSCVLSLFLCFSLFECSYLPKVMCVCRAEEHAHCQPIKPLELTPLLPVTRHVVWPVLSVHGPTGLFPQGRIFFRSLQAC